jgi:hypothetical protein
MKGIVSIVTSPPMCDDGVNSRNRLFPHVLRHRGLSLADRVIDRDGDGLDEG